MAAESNRRWVLAGSMFGVFTGLFAGVSAYRDGAQLTWVVVLGLGTAAVTGVFFALGLRWQLGSLLSAAAELPIEERKRAWRAALRGPVPPDPEIHRVAAQIARRHLASASGVRFVVSLILLVLLTSSSIWLAATTSRWWHWLLAAFFLAMIGMQLWDRRRWQRRVTMLGGWCQTMTYCAAPGHASGFVVVVADRTPLSDSCDALPATHPVTCSRRPPFDTTLLGTEPPARV